MVCDVCSSDLPEGALFCGECGASVVPQSVGGFVAAARGDNPDTEILPRFLDDGTREEAAATGSGTVSVFATPLEQPLPEELPLEQPPLEPPLPEKSLPKESLPEIPLAETPILAALLKTANVAASELSADLPSYTFTLSTGETLAVSANGLLGRMPQPEPGETFAHLIVVTDPTRSVSKTHLEFGFDVDLLWVLDRNSGNGSIIRDVGKIPRRAEPGRQYVVGRGTRIDMGEAQLLIS